MTDIAVLTSVHTAHDIRIYHKECQSLAQAGYSVTLIAPHGQDERAGAIRIRAIPKPKNRVERMTRTLLAIYRAALAEKAQAVHFHDPELIPVGMLLKLRGKKVVYDVHEDVPKQILTKHWIAPAIRKTVAKWASRVEALGAKGFDGIIAVTPGIAQRFPAQKTVTVQNYPILGELAPTDEVPYTDRPMALAYVGKASAIRGAREMVHAMSLLPEELEARLVLVGEVVPETFAAKLQSMPGWDRVESAGWQPRAGVAAALGQVRAGIVVFGPFPNHIEAQPNKLFEYMSAGLPVIASDFALWRKIVHNVGCGLLVDPTDPAAIAGAIEWMFAHPAEAEAMGRRGQEAVRSQYNWAREAEKLIKLYEALIGNPDRGEECCQHS